MVGSSVTSLMFASEEGCVTEVGLSRTPLGFLGELRLVREEIEEAEEGLLAIDVSQIKRRRRQE